MNMTNLSENEHIVNTPSLWAKIGDWYRQNWWNIALFAIIMLSIMFLVGYWRLSILKPEKQPIRFEYLNNSSLSN